MKLGRSLYGYVAALHLPLFAFTIMLFRSQPVVLLAVEAALLGSLAVGFVLARRALQPLAYTERFRDLLQDEDYAARMTHTGMAELDELIQLFNTMLGTLYRERLKQGEQRGFLDSLLEATPSAVLVFDFEGKISLMNASAQALPGLHDALGKALTDCISGEDLGLPAQLDCLPLGESRLVTDGDGRRYRGQRGQFFDRSFARHFVLVEEMTDELESSERATYDKLVRVLAHEVNNTVAATGSVLDSLLYYSKQLTERDSVDFSTAIVAVKRRNASLGEFIERFTRVVKMPEPELRPTSIAALMNDILWLNREQCSTRGITIEWVRCDQVPPLRMDSQLMEQALLNIVKNAMEAAEATQADTGVAGRVELTLANEDGRVRLSIADSGNRLGEVPARQLFTPFFSTKKGGQGIGLMFVREVLTRHGYNYRLAPVHGATCFDIWF